MPHPDDLRCSDEDRRTVEELLSTAFVDGRLDRKEHEQRTEELWRTKTFGELRALTEDLPHSDPLPVQRSEDHQPRPLVVPAESRAPDVLNSLFGDIKRVGGHRLRATTALRSVFGDGILDLRDAVFESERCELRLGMLFGDLTVLVPGGVTVTCRTSTLFGDTTLEHRASTEDTVELVITGFHVFGDLSVRGTR